MSNLGFKWCETAAMFLVDVSSAACEGGEWGGREGAGVRGAERAATTAVRPRGRDVRVKRRANQSPSPCRP